jgi:hypothetical protein
MDIVSLHVVLYCVSVECMCEESVYVCFCLCFMIVYVCECVCFGACLIGHYLSTSITGFFILSFGFRNDRYYLPFSTVN